MESGSSNSSNSGRSNGSWRSSSPDLNYREQMVKILLDWTKFSELKQHVKDYVHQVCCYRLCYYQHKKDALDELRIVKLLSAILQKEDEKYTIDTMLSYYSYLGAVKELMKLPHVKYLLKYDEKILDHYDRQWIRQSVKSRSKLKRTVKDLEKSQRDSMHKLVGKEKYFLGNQIMDELNELEEQTEIEECFRILSRRVVSSKGKLKETEKNNMSLSKLSVVIEDIIKRLRIYLDEEDEEDEDEEKLILSLKKIYEPYLL